MSIQSYTILLALDIEGPRFRVMLSIHSRVLDSILPSLPLLLENSGNGGSDSISVSLLSSLRLYYTGAISNMQAILVTFVKVPTEFIFRNSGIQLMDL